VPIDGVGFQMHWIGNATFVPQTPALVDNLQRFADAGFRVFLFEVDVKATESGLFPTVPEQERQRTVFQNVLQACLQVAACEAY
jgi:GH35 family endo-1,4-beta-xylanase